MTSSPLQELAGKLKQLPPALLLSIVFINIVLILYFTKFQIYPEYRSSDFVQHVHVALSLAARQPTSLSTQFLRYGIDYYLAAWFLAFPHSDPMQTARVAMSELVVISPIIVYLAAKELFGSRGASYVTGAYAFTGVWFAMVYVSGLYAQFLGFIMSLLLCTAAVRLCREGISFRRSAAFIVILVLAYFSHSSTLLIFIPLTGFSLWSLVLSDLGRREWPKSPRAPIFLLVALAAPIVLAPLAFPQLISQMNGLFDPTVLSPVPLTPLAKILTWFPPLANAVGELNDDLLAIAILASSVIFIGVCIRWLDARLWIILGWLAAALVLSPWTGVSWRFAFAALGPLIFMFGYVISRIRPRDFVPGARSILVILLLTLPLFTAWPAQGILSASKDSAQVNLNQINIQAALSWMKTSTPGGCGQYDRNYCTGYVAVTDWRFTFSQYLGGPQVTYAKDWNVIRTDPLQVQLFAATKDSRYIIVSDITTDPSDVPASCPSALAYNMTLSASSTQVHVNDTITLTVRTDVTSPVPVHLFDYGVQVSVAELINGTATFQAIYSTSGLHHLVASLGRVATSELAILIGEPGQPKLPLSMPLSVDVPPYYCQPWGAYNPATMFGWSIVYQNPDVKIWRVNQ